MDGSVWQYWGKSTIVPKVGKSLVKPLSAVHVLINYSYEGRRFYGPEGPYCTFAGRDATRALATFEVNAVKG